MAEPVHQEEDLDWRSRAACQGMDHKDFYPKVGDAVKAERAKAVCRVCPVVLECLVTALQTPQREDHGIWGATGPRERRAMRRSARRAST